MESARAAISVCSLPPCGAGLSHVASFRRTGATSESKSGRARNFGIQPRSRTHDSNPKFPHAIALPCGGGLGRGSLLLFERRQPTPTPTPDPSPQGGGEHTESFARSDQTIF